MGREKRRWCFVREIVLSRVKTRHWLSQRCETDFSCNHTNLGFCLMVEKKLICPVGTSKKSSWKFSGLVKYKYVEMLAWTNWSTGLTFLVNSAVLPVFGEIRNTLRIAPFIVFVVSDPAKASKGIGIWTYCWRFIFLLLLKGKKKPHTKSCFQTQTSFGFR